VKVELLYLDGCSNWRLTEERLITALRLANRSHVTVVRRRVDTDEQAAALGFVGSPTVLIDGRDPFVTGGESVGLTCRLFRSDDGLEGAPGLEQLVEALTRWTLTPAGR
jgi:hypothetical protein